MVFEYLKGLYAVAGGDNDHKILLYFHINDLFAVFWGGDDELRQNHGLEIDKDSL